jgi:hypothetical protein
MYLHGTDGLTAVLQKCIPEVRSSNLAWTLDIRTETYRGFP